MPKKPISVLIADDDEEKCYVMKNFFSAQDEFEICDIVNDGYNALRIVHEKQPDVLLLDIMMPKLDGIEVLNQIGAGKLDKIPKIIMISSMAQSFVTDRAFELGACYYMVKPFNIESLKKMIMLIVGDGIDTAIQNKSKSRYSDPIRRKVLLIGVPTNIIGYKYIVETMEIMLNESCTGTLLKNIYNRLAQVNSTTPQCVESAIRNAIKQAAKNNSESYVSLFGNLSIDNKSPSNLKFLTKITEEIRIEMN